MALTMVSDRRLWTRLLRYATLLAVLAGVYLTSHYSYNLFHGLAELFSVVVQAGVFVIVWNARRYFVNNYVLALGIGLLFVSVVDLLHTLSYQGMNVFPSYSADLPTQLWIVARWLQTLALLVGPVVLGHRLRVGWYVGAFAVIWGVLLVLVFTRVFPAAFVPDSGLTVFKVASEYVICALLLAALGLLIWRRHSFEGSVFRRLAGAIVVSIASELLFTLYVSPFGPANLAGHLLKIVVFYLIYRAVIQTALSHPYSLLFRELKQSEEALKREEEAQRQIADVLQEALLIMPKSPPGISYGHLYRPATVSAKVGGDFADVFMLRDHSIGLLIGDVSGHGLEAAALTAVAKDTIEAFAFDEQSPAAVMRKANLVALRNESAREDRAPSFITAFYGVLDTVSGRLRFSTAGHPPGVVRRATGETLLLRCGSLPLGVRSKASYWEAEETLSAGDLLLLYTDGLTDVRVDNRVANRLGLPDKQRPTDKERPPGEKRPPGEEPTLGIDRLLELVSALDVLASELPEALFKRVMDLSGGELPDDVAILAVSLVTPTS